MAYENRTESTAIDELETQGRLWFRNALGNQVLRQLETNCDLNAKPGQRLAIDDRINSAIDGKGSLLQIMQGLLPGCRPVRCVAFNKTQSNNWSVPWHQDRLIAVRDRVDVSGFSNWSQKLGIWYCEPPVDLLKRMFFVRIHLDDSDERSGCLEIALGTHHNGRISAGDAARVASAAPRELCAATRGDLLVLNMLTLHRSAPSRAKSKRRTYRIDFSADELPGSLQWADVQVR